LPVLLAALWLSGLPGAARAAPASDAAAARQARAAGFDPEKLTSLRAELQRFVDGGQVAGAVTVIGRRGRPPNVETVGFLDREAKVPMTRDTIFRLASMTRSSPGWRS
jgi:CubicO group peptidase (beta-lactamase class C family)